MSIFKPVNSARLTKAVVVGLSAVLALTACGRSDTATDNPQTAAPLSSEAPTGTLTMWAQGASASLLPEMLKEFEAENTGLKVNVTAVPWDAAHNKYQTAIAGGTTPDIAQMGTTWMTDFSNAFDPMPTEISTDGFFPTALESSIINGTKFGVPWYVDTRAFFYRTDLAEKSGFTEFPTTWEGLHSISEAMQEKADTKYGIQLTPGGSDSNQAVLPFLWSNGAEMMNGDQTKWTFDTPEMIGAFEFYQSFFKDGLANINPTVGDEVADFVNGTSPILLGSPSMISQLNKAGGTGFDEKFAVAMLPTKDSATSFIGGSNLVTFKNSKNRDAAWRVIEWFSKPETQLKWNKLVGSLPSNAIAWEDPSLANDEKLSVFGKQLEDTNLPPRVETWTEVSSALDTQIEQIVKGGKDPAQAMKDLQATADSIGVGR